MIPASVLCNFLVLSNNYLDSYDHFGYCCFVLCKNVGYFKYSHLEFNYTTRLVSIPLGYILIDYVDVIVWLYN